MRMLVSSGLLAMLTLLGSGCQSPAVGDPCEPEAIPRDDINGDGRADGFVNSEAYLETSSVQCRTRVCMVYRLSGDPSGSCNPATTECSNPMAVPDRVYCTCRCRAPDDPDATVCECPDGYECTEILELGGPGVRGSYCVKADTVDTEG